jgi:hypothetical protein
MCSRWNCTRIRARYELDSGRTSHGYRGNLVCANGYKHADTPHVGLEEGRPARPALNASPGKANALRLSRLGHPI